MVPRRFFIYFLTAFLLWSGLIVILGWQERQSEQKLLQDLALAEATGSYNKDLVYRRWAAKQGGVYVKLSEYTPPNPYLSHIPYRDITTTTGMKLTLVNPAYMTRQIHEMAAEQYGNQGHITSLSPIRPENRPDPWEQQALISFHQGESEAKSVAEISGRQFARVMYPMVTEKSCLKCHAQQGYREGDIRGGISVSVPLQSYRSVYAQMLVTHTQSTVIIWLVGSTLLTFFYILIRRRFVIELTAKRHAESSERKYRTLFDQAFSGFALADADTGELLECNQSLADMLETTPQELRGRHQSSLHPDGTAGELTANFIRNRDSQTGTIIENRLISSSGRVFPVEIKAQCVRLNGRRMMFGIFYDLSERREAERRKTELEQQLRQKFKMEAIGLMAGGVAHNFNNILSIILGNLELSKLRTGQLPEVTGYLDNAQIGVRRARDLVRSLLTYCRQDSAEEAPVCLATLIQETLGLLQSTVPATITIHSEIPDAQRLTVILGDAGRIQEALFNLCNNAIQAMDEQGTLTITLTSTGPPAGVHRSDSNTEPEEALCIRVTDDGCGMEPAVMEKIFDPFFTTKEPDQGTGMGLATVKGIVEQHRGSIQVTSTPGAGTTFALFFPRHVTTGRESADTDPPELLRGCETILFVDDEPLLVELGKERLESLGYRVSTAHSAEQALRYLEKPSRQFDLLITDQTMPQMSGLELVAELRRRELHLPTILCTGYSSKVNEQVATDTGIAVCCIKPLDMPNLARTVRRVLDTTQQSQTTTTTG